MMLKLLHCLLHIKITEKSINNAYWNLLLFPLEISVSYIFTVMFQKTYSSWKFKWNYINCNLRFYGHSVSSNRLTINESHVCKLHNQKERERRMFYNLTVKAVTRDNYRAGKWRHVLPQNIKIKDGGKM